MKREEKKALLTALKTIEQEYKTDTHHNSSYNCKLCNLYKKECSKCIMNVFSDYSAGCSYRKNCSYSFKASTKLKRSMLAFYKSAIKHVHSTPAELINGPFNLDNNSSFAKELRRLDYDSI